MKIYPAIDLRGGQCVRLKQGDYNQETIFGDNPAEMALQWEQQGAEFLHLVDLDGAKAGKPVNLDSVKAICDAIQIPCQLGGGIRTEESIDLLLKEVGVDRVIVGTQALKEPDWFRAMTEKYPNQIVLGLDAKNSMVATAGWLEVSQTSAIELAKQYSKLQLAAIIYTNIANDGMMQGVGSQTIADMCELSKLGISVIASGGVTSLDDVREITTAFLSHPHLDGMIIGRALYENAMSINDVNHAVLHLTGDT